MKQTQQPIVNTEINLVGTFNAPIELVFEAWTKPKHLVHWFGPNGFTTPVAELDAVPGGNVRVCMKGPDGKEYWSRGNVVAIDPPRKVVLETGVDDDNGKVMFETRATATFEEADGKTVLNLNDKVISINDPASAESLNGMEQGWQETIDKLQRYIEAPQGEDR